MNLKLGRRAFIVTTATSVVAGLGAIVAPSAAAAAGPNLSYVVNALDKAQTADAAAAVTEAGGQVMVSYAQIGVVIARSTDPAFAQKVKTVAHGGAVQSAGATRTAALPAMAGEAEGADAYAPDDLENATRQSDMVLIGARAAHEVNLGSPSVTVGVLDDGIDANHQDLAPVVDQSKSVNCVGTGAPDTTPGAWRPTSLTADYHGTHVAGTIASAKNGVGIVGVAPGVKLASIKVVNTDGFIYPEYAICGFVWAAEHGIQVTNNSYYIDPWLYWCESQADQAPVVEAVRRAVDYTTEHGILNVAAAGNENQDLASKTVDTTSPDDTTPSRRTLDPSCLDLPSELPNVVSVSSTTQPTAPANAVGPWYPGLTTQPARSSFSSFGLGAVDVAAPGSSIYSTSPSTGVASYRTLSGTSMASPHVAGVAALLVSKHPGATPDYIRELLRKQAIPLACPTSGTDYTQGRCKVDPNNPNVNGFFGYGLVNAYKAVTEADDVTPPTVKITGVGQGQQITLGTSVTPGCSTTDSDSGVAVPATLSVTGGPTVGYFTATCSGARDRAGNNAAPVSVTYQVVYDWQTFGAPVSADKANSAKAGSAVPIKFGLGGDQGLGIFAAGAPQLQPTTCDTWAPKGGLKPTATPGASTLTYDPVTRQYQYNWKTDKSLANSCGRLEVTLIDGTTHTANFLFN
ncbi:S8 family serine peptidase [Planosporangium thailandense]|uniref:S8 family serine peptidase n=1 Tax=Planosporangium thailandense TaxID=765197 RepID=A0ABX0XS15_9ACTN|nr:S8 family serine peptidase [Planosporangium thailandense]NJC68758.1 S8 family serine peptidase [Planosporangium thailandense]